MADVAVEPPMESTITHKRTTSSSSSPTPRIHALMWANFAILISILFGCGMFYQRVTELETRVKSIQSTDALIIQIADLKNEVNRLRDRLDRLIDNSRSQSSNKPTAREREMDRQRERDRDWERDREQERDARDRLDLDRLLSMSKDKL